MNRNPLPWGADWSHQGFYLFWGEAFERAEGQTHLQRETHRELGAWDGLTRLGIQDLEQLLMCQFQMDTD